jgi:hypothetical protein
VSTARRGGLGFKNQPVTGINSVMTHQRARWLLAPAVILYAVGLCLFYVRYVPLTGPFQAALVPILALSLILTLADLRWGTLFFVFAFPLINNLPYLVGIFEDTPHAPTALVLFLFFFLGFLLRALFRGPALSLREPISRPLAAFSIMVFVSGIITGLRYADFYPLRGGSFYELPTNVAGVTAGGAIMSVVFFSLNYLTGIAFFFVFLKTASSRAFLKRAVIILGVSTSFSLGFGLYQHLGNIKLGSSPLTFDLRLINATFKDALSFGAFLAMTVALTLGACLAFRGLLRLAAFLVTFFSLFMVLFSGSKSGLLTIPISLGLFGLLSLGVIVPLVKARPFSLKRVNWASWVIIALVVTAALAGIRSRAYLQKELAASRSIIRTRQTLDHARSGFGREVIKEMLGGRVDSLWKMAIAMFKDYPLSGVGIGAYVIEVSNYSKLYAAPLIPQSAENYVLQVGSEFGFIGILLVLWILWEIVRQVRRSYLGMPATDHDKFILIGAISGVAAFILLVQTHTFVGSYEIKYTFWLLVGIIYVFGRTRAGQNEDGGPKPLFGAAHKTAGLVGLSLFAGSLLWTSTHSLSLRSRTEQFGLKQAFGFYQAEKTNDGRIFRWTREYAGLTIKVAKPVIVIPLLVSHPDVQLKPVKVRIYLFEDFFERERLLAELTVNQGTWETYECEAPQEVGREVTLLFKVSRTWNPLKTLGAPDPRRLGVAVGAIEFKDRRVP